MTPGAVGAPPAGALRQAATTEHQGTVIAFARSDQGTDLFYNFLDLKVSTAVDNDEWTGYAKLGLPGQLRPIGLDIVTVDDPHGAVLRAADAPLKALSDGKYVHLLQQSTRGTLLLNRFMLKRVAPPGGGPAAPVLEPVWEVRYQRSGKQDIPDGDRDTQNYAAPGGDPFIEPTLELPMIRDLAGGCFEALILPNQTGTANRWQFFAANARTGTLDLYSFPMDGEGLPDLTGARLDAEGNVVPDASAVLELRGPSAPGPVPLTLAGVPSAVLYTVHERVRASSGDDLLLKRAARVMLAQPVTQPGGRLQVATLDFALGKDGRLTQLPQRTVVSPVAAANYALHFADGAYLGLPVSQSLRLSGPYTTEFWFYPDGDAAADQFVFRGDPAVAATQAAPYVKITRDLRVTTGFGTGTVAVAASTTDPVITAAQWVHVTVAYDDARDTGNFTVLINGDKVPVTGADVKARPAGNQVTTIGGRTEGVIGVIDGLKLWNGSALAADWEFDAIDYSADPPLTLDSTQNGNNAAVYGATLVHSSAPTGQDTQGNLVIDADGKSLYCGLLTFAEPGDSPRLAIGSEGQVHMYFAGRDGLFSVAQYDTQTARAVFEAGWTSTADGDSGPALMQIGTTVRAGTTVQTGTVQFTAARSGSFTNQAALTIRPTDLSELCDIDIDDKLGRTETWQGVPRALDNLVAVLNGDSTHDLADPAFRAGARTFYDNTGTYAMSRLTVRSHGSDAGLILLSRDPAALQLGSAAVGDVSGDTCTLTLTFAVGQWPDTAPITQLWTGLPVFAGPLLTVLSGTSPSYDYSPTDSATAAVHGLAAHDAAQASHDVLVLTRPGVRDLSLEVDQGARPELCTVRIALYDGAERRFELTDVPREQAGFAAAVNADEAGRCLLLVTDGLTASVRDRSQAPLPPRDLRAWSTLTAAFAEEALAADAVVPAQAPVPAAVRQRSVLTVDGRETPLEGASTLFRALAATEPTNGGVAMVANTSSYTGGTANLAAAAVDGGWIRVSPHKALSFAGSSAVFWNQAAPSADVLAIPGDLSVEAWCRPEIISSDDARPRLASYMRTGAPDLPDERISWAMGLAPAPSLRIAYGTEINGSCKLGGTDCTLQLTFCPSEQSPRLRLIQLATAGSPEQPYLGLSVDNLSPVASYANGALKVTGPVLGPWWSTWRQATATLEAIDASTVRLRLYINGMLQGEDIGARVDFSQTPGAIRVGATGGQPMQANGAFMWNRALDPDEVARTVSSVPRPNDRGLVLAWYLTEGEGAQVRNTAVEGNQSASGIIGPVQWGERGAFAQPWAANRGYGLLAPNDLFSLLGGWQHLAFGYRTAYALELGGADYADCGADGSLDFDSAFALEACFTPDRTGAVQTLVSKPGNYELSLNYDDTVLLTVPTDSAAAGTIRVASPGRVTKGAPYYVAASIATGATKVPPPANGQPARPAYYLTIDLYVNGVFVASHAKYDYAEPVRVSTSSQRLNLGRSTAGAAYFTGLLSDVRLWNKALTAGTIKATQSTHRIASADGLVSWWRWSESRGKYAHDENNLNNAVLTANDLWNLYASNATFDLYANGVQVSDVRVIDPGSVGGYGVEQFTVGAKRTGDSALADQFTGQVSEVRVWNQERTAEQVREDMYRKLTGTEAALAGYWTFDTGSGALAPDATGHGNDGALVPPTSPPTWVTARAPISDEAKEVYNILGGVVTEYVERISGIPAVTEYPDTRRDAYGAFYSVMKRCYAAQVRGAVDLITGFTVGDLNTAYAGQAQSAPTLIGFIEGAPPIPSENQTNPWWNDVNSLNTYAGNTTVRLTQAQSTTRAFTGSERTADSMSIDGKVGVYLSVDSGISVGVGSECEWQLDKVEGHLGYVGGSSTETAAEQELAFGFGKATTTVDELSAAGEWEPADHVLNPEVGRRYIPGNNGYALVKSLTADMYLVTLKGSNTVVKMTLVPSADIPEDVNLIPFPIDPGYTKNGTLDGLVGFTPDPSFPYADLQPSSYFRPIEAYSLKRQMERQDKQLEAYYRQFDTANLSRGVSLGAKTQPAAIETGFTSFRDRILPADPSYDWQKGLAKRGIANTYVWTAAGGLHSEQSELVDTYSESYCGTSGWDVSNGLGFDMAAGATLGLYSEFDALFGASVEVVSIRSQDSESGFGLEAEFAPDRYLKRPVLDGGGQPVGYTPDDAPGKVAGYRFMSFFLPPSEQNFAVFNTQVVDRNWLRNSADPNAAALRTATVQANGAWRVLHRTTYVNRVPPRLQRATAETTAQPVVPPAGLPGNTVLTRLIESRIATPAPSPAQIGAAVTDVLGLSPADPGLLAGVLPWWTEFLAAAAAPRSDAHGELAQLRVDLLDYMVRKYAAQAAQAGGATIARLMSAATGPAES